MSENVWYPLSSPGASKIPIKSAEGIYLYDRRGKEYMDANSGLWNVPLGYRNENIIRKIQEQLDQFCYLNPCEFYQMRKQSWPSY
jgi:adenosylmethionine-8-amino-7-oxononanoate aminotransferase